MSTLADLFGQPQWAADMQDTLTTIQRQNNLLLRLVYTVMADVKIAQEDLDTTASVLRELVDKLNSLDLTPLPSADQSALVSAVTAVTDAVNRVTGPKTPDVPAPNPEPEPTETPEPEAPAEETPTDG